MKILAIETSCDETSAAVVEDGRVVLSNLIASQVGIHARYGGIVPEIASRQHMLEIVPVVKGALSEAGLTLVDLDAIAVTRGPGLAGALMVGVNMAKGIAMASGLPILGVNHLEGHIYANWLLEDDQAEPCLLPAVALIASGGHTDLVVMRDHGDFQLLGRTRDDAAGEAFDKVARVLGLGYPGGPAIQEMAKKAKTPHRLPRAWLKGSDDFSFSGIKTAVRQLAQEMGIFPPTSDMGQNRRGKLAEAVASVAAGFQIAVSDVLVTKTLEAARRSEAREVMLAGGVAANTCLRQMLAERSPLPVRYPKPILCTDNAAMIGACAYYRYEAGVSTGWELDVMPNLRIG